MRLLRPLALGALLNVLAVTAACAGVAPFDLAGPHLQVTVEHSHLTLPISEVPNLSVGDRLWIRADLPSSESEHYLLVVAFLRGATNPPPRDWFHACAAWKRLCARQGLHLTVPAGAGQVLVFLAPEAGGDLRTLIDAVRGRPGAFVRTSQDLNQATLDSSRLARYLRAIHALDERSPGRIREVAPLLARSLAIKVKSKCLQRLPELQAPCLMKGQSSLILNDGHSTSIVEALTSGPASDLAMQASYSPQLSYGYYSPYIASLLDIARIFSSFTTARYQYIPALATLHGEVLALTLNTPPSFHDPKSVLVTALPAVEPPQPPPLHAVDPKEIYCARKSALVLPVEGAPLVFSTDYAHGLRLWLVGSTGATVELPARADPEQGGIVADTAAIGTARLGDSVRGALEGYWGFQRYSGPTFKLVNVRAEAWALSASDGSAAIVGREDTIHLTASSVSCIDSIMLRDPSGKTLKVDWKRVHSSEVQVKLPLTRIQPGPLTLLVKQFGPNPPQPVSLEAYSEAARLDSFTLHAGDSQGVLAGSRLDEVAGLAMDGVAFVPGALSSKSGVDRLTMTAQDAQAAAALKEGESGLARVRLKDGRLLELEGVVGAPRPSVTLLAKSVQPSARTLRSHIHLAADNELPEHALLTFSLRAGSPAAFDRDETIEVATADREYSASLTLTNGGLTLATRSVAIATLDPAKAFGRSAFGPLQFRVIDDGVKGDWQPLATLVRLPRLRQLLCPATPELACKLSGSGLYLVDAISSNAEFDHPVQVPDGFPGYALPVPHPVHGALYVRLRDDPSVINRASLAAEELPPTREEASRASVRRAAASSPGDDTATRAKGARGGSNHSRTPGITSPNAGGSGAVPGAAPAKPLAAPPTAVTDGAKPLAAPPTAVTDGAKPLTAPPKAGADGAKPLAAPPKAGADGAQPHATPPKAGSGGAKPPAAPPKAGADGAQPLAPSPNALSDDASDHSINAGAPEGATPPASRAQQASTSSASHEDGASAQGTATGASDSTPAPDAAPATPPGAPPPKGSI
jgi:hypothetical protein